MVTYLPVVPKVTITSPTSRTFDPLNSTFDFNLTYLKFNQSSEGKAGSFTMRLEDSNAALAGELDCGDAVQIWLAKALPFTENMFYGKVQKFKRIRPSKDVMTYELFGYDLTERLARRIINMQRIQARTGDGVTPDSSDSSTELGALMRDLCEDTDAYPTGEPTLETDESLTFDVDSTGIKVPSFIADYKNISSAGQDLAKMCERNLWINEDKVLKFKSNTLVDSGILIVDDPNDATALTWDTTKLGFITQDKPLEVEDTIEDTVNRLFGLGGDEMSIDQKQETTSGGNDALNSLYRAVKFTPAERRHEYVAVYIGSSGSPGVPLEGEVREDNAGEPTGALVKAWSIREAVVTPGGAWVIADLGADKIQTGKAHWLILYKKGSAGNTYNWYHDGGSASTIATSADGVTWSVTASTKGYAFRTYNAARLLTVSEDSTSRSNYGISEDVYSNPEITERITMQRLVDGMTSIMSQKKRVLSASIFPPDTMIRVGQYLRVIDSKTAVDSMLEVVNVEYEFDSEGDQKGCLGYDITAVGLVP